MAGYWKISKGVLKLWGGYSDCGGLLENLEGGTETVASDSIRFATATVTRDACSQKNVIISVLNESVFQKNEN